MYNQDPLEYYKVLEVSPNADARTIKISYRDRAKEWHPDYNKAEDAMEHFQKISVAYDVLHDENKKLVYDLLSCIYERENFPQMDALSILKDRMGEENPDVRVFDLRYVFGKIIKYSAKEERLICSESQAFNEILKCSLSNWFCGWWGIKAFAANCKALVSNYKNTGTNRQDNLTVLLHNALAYQQENKSKQALYSALLAMEYILPEQRPLLEKFIQKLGGKVQKAPRWRWTRLKLAQLIVPFVLLMVALSPIADSMFGGLRKYADKENEITYFQKVQFNDGGETFDDVVVSKIFDIPVDVFDESKLFHLTENENVMYGPGRKFDVMAKVQKGQTVRVTGFTPDRKWYRIMLDNGEMGFVEQKKLKKGRGNAVPENSKIISVQN